MKLAYAVGLSIACFATSALGKPAYVGSTLNLRAAPGTGSEIVQDSGWQLGRRGRM